MFDDPDLEERTLYCKYWQAKLKDNKYVAFPDSLVDDVASSTELFSFAYLKEALCVLSLDPFESTIILTFHCSVSSLVLLAGFEEEDKPEFETLIKAQIKTLRKQLDKPPKNGGVAVSASSPSVPARPEQSQSQSIRALLDELSVTDMGSKKMYTTAGASPTPTTYNEVRRVLLDGLLGTAGNLKGGVASSKKVYTTDATAQGDPSRKEGRGY